MAEISPANETWLMGQWVNRLSQAVAMMMGDAPKVTLGAAPQESPTGEDIFWWKQAFGAPPEAALWVGAPSAVWKTIGNEVLKSAGIDDADDANIKSTYLEVLSQSLAGLAQALSARARSEISCVGGGQTTTRPESSLPVVISLGDAELTVFAAASQALVDLCDGSVVALAPNVSDAKPKSAIPKKEAPADARGYPKGLDLLLDVELPVSVSFGRAELPIKDVIKLTSGSIVELNRSITEPVEIIVNNVIIARGEVVVVEGNFGVRIKQVISRQERLRTLS